jgi:peroxiredoxin Q/BCP
MKKLFILTTALFMLTFSLKSSPLNVGTEAPAPVVPNHLGESVDLAKLYESSPVLLYFYPKSDTPGCTRQACNLRDNFSELKEAGMEIVGVSMDSVEDQLAFKEKYDLPFILIADKDKTLGKAFGVGSYAGMAYKRQSFLIVGGNIVWRDLGATPTSQSSDALAALQQIQASE